MTADTKDNSGAALRALFLIQLVSMGAMEMSGPFWPLHLRALDQLSPQGLAWASAVAYAGPMAMAMCFAPLWGRLGDSIGHKPMLLRALIALAATQLWIAAADSVAMVLIARLAQGALAGFIAAAQAYGASVVTRDRRSTLMARLQVATAVGSMLGPLAGGLMFDGAGFRVINLAAAVLCLGCTVLAVFILPAVPPSPKAKTATTEEAKSSTSGIILILLAAIVLVQTGKMMPQTFFGLFAEQVLNTPAWLTGLCYGATALGLCLAAPFWGRHFDARPAKSVLTRVEWICWACAAIVAVQALSRDMAVFIAARLLWGACLAALLPVFYGLLSRETQDGSQGRILGLGNSAAKAGALVGAGAGGLVLSWISIEHVMWPVAAVYVIAAIGLRFMRRSTQADAVDSNALA